MPAKRTGGSRPTSAMPPGALSSKERLTRLLPFLGASLLAMVVGLMGLVAFVAIASSRLAERERDITEDMAPTILAVNAAIVDLNALEDLLDDRLRGSGLATDDALGERWTALDGDIEGYLTLPLAPGEAPLYGKIQHDKHHLDETYRRILASPMQLDPRREESLRTELDSSVRDVETALLQAGKLNAERARKTTVVLSSVRHMLLPAAIGLELACILAAALALGAAYRVARIAAEASDEARAALELRATELDAFSARVAHDVLSPLQGVSLALAVAERGLASQPDHHGPAAVARAQATLERVRRMCADLLEFARAGAMPLAAESEPAAVLGGVLEDLAPIAEQVGVEIVQDARRVRRVHCAAGVLSSVVSNLVKNAIQHGAGTKASQVTVRVRDDGPNVHFEVQDSGPGIPFEEQASVFEPYVRGKGARATGLGLGLATVRRLVQANGGDVGVESEPGCGARFWFTLPAA